MRHVTIRGNQLEPPLLVTEEATAIEFRDDNGELRAVFARGMLGPEAWIYTNCNDSDWTEVLMQLGYTEEQQ